MMMFFTESGKKYETKSSSFKYIDKFKELKAEVEACASFQTNTEILDEIPSSTSRTGTISDPIIDDHLQKYVIFLHPQICQISILNIFTVFKTFCRTT